jgi:hypothetical protein
MKIFFIVNGVDVGHVPTPEELRYEDKLLAELNKRYYLHFIDEKEES